MLSFRKLKFTNTVIYDDYFQLDRMKINSAHLQNSCSSSQRTTPGGATRRGFLLKKSESSRGFHKRWFLLQDNLLFYFSHKRSEEPTAAAPPVGLIVLEGCCVERLEGLTFQLMFPGSGERKYVLAAETEEEREDWMQAMISAGYGFMQYAISEMEKTIDDALAQQRNVATASTPEDTVQKVTSGGCGPSEVKGPVEVKRGQVTFVEGAASLSPLAVGESRGIADLSNCRLIFEQMHLRFREEIKRKTKEQHKQAYANQ